MFKIAEALLDFCHSVAAEDAFADHRLLEVFEAFIDVLESLPHLGAQTVVLLLHIRAEAIVLFPQFAKQAQGLVFGFGHAGCPREHR